MPTAPLVATLLVAPLLALLPTPTAYAEITEPTPDTAVVSVQVGADRTGVRGVTPRPDVVLGLFSTASGGDEVARCTADADGDCNLVVDDTGVGGDDRGRRFWVRSVSVPDEWYANPTLGTGGGGVEETAYRFQTPPLVGGQVYRSGFAFMAAEAGSGGVWQQSRVNPELPDGCGLDVALVLDLSGSVAGELPRLKAAAGTVVDALVGTSSRVSLFSFSDDSPATGGANFPSLTQVSTPAGANAVKARWSAWTAGGGTSWDRGLARVAAATDEVDVAILITDDTPSTDDPGITRLRDVEAAVFSANAVKARGTRVVAVGVGEAIDGATAGLDLRAVSGDAQGADYLQVADYDAAGAAVRDLVRAVCVGSVSVTKQLVPSDNVGDDVTGAEPAPGGWTFEATGSTGVTVDAPATREIPDDGTGTVAFPLSFAGNGAPVTLVEQAQPGYTLVRQGGQNAECLDLQTGAALPVTNAGAVGFSVTATPTAAVACTVYNKAAVPGASVRVDKRWVVNGVTYADGEQPDALQAQLELSGPADRPAGPQSWGAPRTGYESGDDVTVDETGPTPGDLCTLDSRELTGGGPALDLPASVTLSAGENRFTITNTLTCRSELTLAKEVVNGSADPETWTLTATGPDGALPGPSGATGSAGTVTPDVAYALREDDGDPNYEQQDVDDDPSTRPWLCVEVTAAGAERPGFRDGLDGTVTVPVGTRVRCTAYNQTALLRLRKVVDDAPGGTASPSDWTLTATPADPPAGVTAQSVTGSAAYVTLEVRPGVTYAISESGPDGYVRSVRCAVGADPPAERATLAVPALEVGSCTITNRFVASPSPSPTPSPTPSASPTSVADPDPGDRDETLADTGGPGAGTAILGALLLAAGILLRVRPKLSGDDPTG